MKQLVFLIFLVFISCQDNENKSDLPVMGDLPLGDYPVGFKTVFTYDPSKNAVPFADWDGNLFAENLPEKGRQFQINIWYPAEKRSGDPLKYSDYVDLMGRQTNFKESEEQDLFARDLFISQTRALGNLRKEEGDNQFTSEQLDQLLELDVLARLNAKAVDGQFPVVLYPNGGSPAYQSISCEFLASHGYVAVAFVPKGRFSSGLEVSSIGLEVAVDDLEFVLGKISEEQVADMNKVSILANAIHSSVGAAAISRNEKIKALISLEGGLPSAFEQSLLSESVFYQSENIKVPILFIYSPHPSIDPEYTFHLKYSDRYYAFFPQMSEFVMLNYGMFDGFIPGILGEHSGNTKTGFETANMLTLRFLNQKIKDEPGELFDASFVSSKTHIDTTFVLPGLPAPPNMAILKNHFMKDGMESIEKIYENLKMEGNSQPFSKDFYTDYRSWLAWQKDENYDNRLRLYELAYDSYPESARINYYVAYYSMKRQKNEQAIKYYYRALALLESDEELNANEKSRLKNYATEELGSLIN
jgi:tetratricopeptide (TPR) repeat protein